MVGGAVLALGHCAFVSAQSSTAPKFIPFAQWPLIFNPYNPGHQLIQNAIQILHSKNNSPLLEALKNSGSHYCQRSRGSTSIFIQYRKLSINILFRSLSVLKEGNCWKPLAFRVTSPPPCVPLTFSSPVAHHMQYTIPEQLCDPWEDSLVPSSDGLSHQLHFSELSLYEGLSSRNWSLNFDSFFL